MSNRTIQYVDNTDANGIRIRNLLYAHDLKPGFHLSFDGKIRRGKLKRYTHHLGYHGAVVRFDQGGGSHYHGFFTILNGEAVHLGKAPPPPKEPGRVKLSRTVTQTVSATWNAYR